MSAPDLRHFRAPLATALSALLLVPGVVHADQFRQSADGGTIECEVSARELTRFSLIGDGFASVTKVGTGTPYNDFSVSNEPVRGDVYVSVPESFAPGRISFFATSKKGYVYKFACAVQPIEAQQVFVANPALAQDEARSWEAQTPIQSSALRLIQAMASGGAVPGYTIDQSTAPPHRAGALEVRLIAGYRGARLAGKTIRITNRGETPMTISEQDLAPTGALAITLGASTLAPGGTSTAYIVGLDGEKDHD